MTSHRPQKGEQNEMQAAFPLPSVPGFKSLSVENFAPLPHRSPLLFHTLSWLNNVRPTQHITK